jgi:hypothetical protein
MKPLSPGDPGYFTTYSTDAYDRHHYKVHFKDGRCIVIEDYDLVRTMWFQSKSDVESVEIIDPKPKKTGGKGF